MLSPHLLKPAKYLLLSFLIALSIIMGPGVVTVARSQAPQQAQLLLEKGQAHLDQGNPQAALQNWKQAADRYRQLQDQQGVTKALISQGIALQDMGNFPLACTTLLKSLQSEELGWLCNPFLNSPPREPMKILKQALKEAATPVALTGVQELGIVLQRLGSLPESELILQTGLEQSKRLANSEAQSNFLVSLGNTEQAFYIQARDRYAIAGDLALQETLFATAQAKAKEALTLYRHSIEVSPGSSQLQAQLNALSLLVNAQQWTVANQASDPRLEAFQAEISSQIPPLLNELQASSAIDQLPPAESGYARLKFAQQLFHLKQHSAANKQAQQALQTTQALNDPRLKSFSFGVLGQFSQQPTQAQAYLDQAIDFASQADAPELAYQWQYERGQLYRQQGKLQSAIAAYKGATDSLDQVRGNLATTSNLQWSFQEEVEPIYRQYMELLLEAPETNLERVIEVNESFQVAELENFLRCGRMNLIPLAQMQSQATDPPVVVHIIKLADRYEVIVRSADLSLHQYSPDPQRLKTSAQNLLALIQDPSYQYSEPQATQAQGQALYQLLLAPAEAEGTIPPSGTLVFVLDGALQNIPMTLLHDGEDFLIRRYRLAVALGPQVQQPRQLDRGKLQALVGGLSERSPSFEAANAPRGLQPLPQTRKEVAAVGKAVDVAQSLLDQDFTTQQLQTALNRERYSILHLSTHGTFSSNPQQTVLLDWNQAIDVQQLNQLIEGTPSGGSSALDLLVLSACQSAKGDQRSALGLAGVATQAGARSTLASLWQVNAESTAQLMGGFYQHLKSQTKAEAIRNAQLAMLNDHEHPEWNHPYHWSGFILVGGWL